MAKHRAPAMADDDSLSDAEFDELAPPPQPMPLARSASGRPSRAAAQKPPPPPILLEGDSDLSDVPGLFVRPAVARAAAAAAAAAAAVNAASKVTAAKPLHPGPIGDTTDDDLEDVDILAGIDSLSSPNGAVDAMIVDKAPAAPLRESSMAKQEQQQQQPPRVSVLLPFRRIPSIPATISAAAAPGAASPIKPDVRAPLVRIKSQPAAFPSSATPAPPNAVVPVVPPRRTQSAVTPKRAATPMSSSFGSDSENGAAPAPSKRTRAVASESDDDDDEFVAAPAPPRVVGARKSSSAVPDWTASAAPPVKRARMSAPAKIAGVSTRSGASTGETLLRPLSGMSLGARPLGLGTGLSRGPGIVLSRNGSNLSSKSDNSMDEDAKPPSTLFLETVGNKVNPHAIRPFKPPTFKSAVVGAMGQHNPTINRTLGMRAGVKPPARPLHDPEEEGALVLWRPPEVSETEKMLMKEEDKKVAVVVDPTLSKILRPHQIEGVDFMYRCVTGAKVEGVFGCIMADEMGLGKTLQCITLLWTLLRQSPIPGKSTCEKVIIVCPSSLVRNWANELIKWLGKNAIHPLCADNKGSKEESTRAIKQFVAAQGRAVVNPILIISYESLRLYAPVLGQTPIGLMLCDEGHRLKNSTSQTFVALNQLNVPRRVILSGTPIQNDLTEYFSLLNFACPGLLGNENEFRRNFELPIMRGRDSEATDTARAASDAKLAELVGMASRVMIRRTQDLLRKYLPTKHEHVVFCKLGDAQLSMYSDYLQSSAVKALLRGKDSQPLKAIGYLKKLVNHPTLVEEKRPLRVDESGKLVVLERMLHKIKTTTKDKIVLISNYTQTLDLFERLCTARGWAQLRLDGTMAVKKRQKLVDQFNDPAMPEFIFLLSSKAGGCGINLIGANRLVLFDPDWNPASDMQALARVWRDGQKKTCFIYRFVATGTIEEKIFQRQCHKQMLSNCVVDEELDVERHFSLEGLRTLFTYNSTTLSDTHDTFKCKRCVNNRQFRPPPRDTVSARNAATDMSLWNHYSELELPKVPDQMLRECGQGVVSFCFQNTVDGGTVAALPVQLQEEQEMVAAGGGDEEDDDDE